jgi:hypothetical protein
MNDLHEVQKEMIRFLRNLPEVSPLEIKDEFKFPHDYFNMNILVK